MRGGDPIKLLSPADKIFSEKFPSLRLTCIRSHPKFVSLVLVALRWSNIAAVSTLKSLLVVPLLLRAARILPRFLSLFALWIWAPRFSEAAKSIWRASGLKRLDVWVSKTLLRRRLVPLADEHVCLLLEQLVSEPLLLKITVKSDSRED